MATRRDQLHSYQFLTQRVISAFVMRETDPAQSPLRRGVGAVFGGVMIAVLVAAGFGIYGIITKIGSDGWKTDGAVVIEKETGASFVYAQGVLRPTLNYTSAVLASGRPSTKPFRVSSNSLREVPRGTTVGIPGAPDSLPSAKRRVGLPWTVCATPGTDTSGSPTSTVTLVVAGAPTGGRAVGADEGILVRDIQRGETYLVWHGHRHGIASPDRLVPALFGTATPALAGTAWLNSLTAGADITRITIDDRGNPSTAFPDRAIGDVLIAQTGSGPQHYLVFDDGVAAITPLQLAVLGAEYEVRPVEVPLSVVTPQDKQSARLRPVQGDIAPPTSVPTLVQASGNEQLCAVTADAQSTAAIRVGGTVAGLETATPTRARGDGGVALADRVLVPAGRIAVVRVLGAPTAEAGPYYLVTDVGIKYAAADEQVLTLLGYPPQEAVNVPAALVSRIPSGPTLDPVRAGQPATIP
ncbi:type VII secretion protein EccB [Phytohabitans rumicis]|uniref:Type VII secretion protein EccB n=1 Tax=Phytohabitans rumicis TaxID=1076125 RepID=A0A6V8KZG1_9ACTN|nr:type VII secretion protein EccB [Phytohabitans rumicis]GFJ88740.1 type VII secretion protein EccB [Phytohabitans rumicis]